MKMPEFEFIDFYTVEIKAVEYFNDETEESIWKFIIQYKVIDDDYDGDEPPDEFVKIVEIPSYRTYEDMFDAIQDAYGVIELVGFQFADDKPQQVEVLRYNPVDNEYVSDYILYDGFDFYPPETEEDNTETENNGEK
jgi:hypothetical protein